MFGGRGNRRLGTPGKRKTDVACGQTPLAASPPLPQVSFKPFLDVGIFSPPFQNTLTQL